MFIFYFLAVGPPCCSILCQFWLCEEAQCVYLRRHLDSSPESFLNNSFIDIYFNTLQVTFLEGMIQWLLAFCGYVQLSSP